jgi:hypothetical protein
MPADTCRASGQCTECNGTFEDFNGGICNVCQSRLAKK